MPPKRGGARGRPRGRICGRGRGLGPSTREVSESSEEQAELPVEGTSRRKQAAAAAAAPTGHEARSRAQRAASTLDDVPSVVAATPTIPLQSTPATTFVLQHHLYFLSAGWISSLRLDVDELLDSFVEAYRGLTTGDEQSPFQVFKSCWIATGWSRIHLFGIMEGRARQSWGESILRGFLERLVPDSTSEPLIQVAAFFAIYTFFSAQADTQEQVYIKIDPPTLEHLLNLPHKLASALDSHATSDSPSSSLIVQPSLDLHQVLLSLLEAQAFFIVPSETFLHPRQLPTVHLVPHNKQAQKQEQKRKDDATITMAIRDELRVAASREEESIEQTASTVADLLAERKAKYTTKKTEVLGPRPVEKGGEDDPTSKEMLDIILARAKKATWENLTSNLGKGIDGMGVEGANLLNLLG
ncbi:BZ3500_MvSof-1268-A1-R1_Chr9g10617 [Microbotryum saponariae]|uniref:BZ3500_MvSof-1268-A1-R1_Chr9g10617 protein n=1 Tax=Microbotryum saponariae TaxID=289078 RepID=A0A2X0LV62_9BASI|nr:BZ3501_MvSof-1269-A2-R1_Chr9g10365 [Microbotryum saponariae]SDA00395.1 BZ3500_MvSof-1268-A1-R1_Chr9g10617 [Microbotryum saponariae]